ncbi:MAG: GAF domain-containing protein [Gemmatimonadaceae bacterium]|nr:GAF domain-containing protein [Gemmatimonadaceae bacterium]
MAESIPDLRNEPKDAAYAELYAHATAALEGIEDPIAMMATLTSLIHISMGHLWTGFYRVVDHGKLLRVGPYQGSLGCLEIRFGQGVCGASAERGETVIVPDVEKFAGHITCDSRSKSEIVVPVRNASGVLIAVLDIDSSQRDTFNAVDQAGLEKIVRLFATVT